jgi:hypothetical protein
VSRWGNWQQVSQGLIGPHWSRRGNILQELKSIGATGLQGLIEILQEQMEQLALPDTGLQGAQEIPSQWFTRSNRNTGATGAKQVHQNNWLQNRWIGLQG